MEDTWKTLTWVQLFVLFRSCVFYFKKLLKLSFTRNAIEELARWLSWQRHMLPCLLTRFAPWNQGKLVPQLETHPDGKPLWNKVKVGLKYFP